MGRRHRRQNLTKPQLTRMRSVEYELEEAKYYYFENLHVSTNKLIREIHHFLSMSRRVDGYPLDCSRLPWVPGPSQASHDGEADRVVVRSEVDHAITEAQAVETKS